MITFIRSDDRLIHGQVQTKIIPLYQINRVIAIDEVTAANPMLKKIFEMAAPQGVRATVQNMEDACTAIGKCIVNDKRTLILARRPSILTEVFRRFPELPKELNVANIPKEGEGFQIAHDIWIDSEQLAAIKELDSLGIDIHFQLYPGMQGSTCYWKDVKDKY